MLHKICPHVVAAATAVLALSQVACGPIDEIDDEEEIGFDEFGAKKEVPVIVGTKTAWVHFARPKGGKDQTIIDEVIRLIRGTSQGGTIHAAIYSLSIPEVAQALIDVQNLKNVTVQVVIDGSEKFKKDGSLRDASKPSMLLATALNGHLPVSDEPSEDGGKMRFCGDGVFGGPSGCITNATNGIMHTKFFTFSGTETPDGDPIPEVVWFGSANMTDTTGTESFNNVITIYGDDALFGGFETYFNDLNEQNKNNRWRWRREQSGSSGCGGWSRVA